MEFTNMKTEHKNKYDFYLPLFLTTFFIFLFLSDRIKIQCTLYGIDEKRERLTSLTLQINVTVIT